MFKLTSIPRHIKHRLKGPALGCVKHGARTLNKSPSLRKLTMTVLHRLPGLHARLRRLHWQNENQHQAAPSIDTTNVFAWQHPATSRRFAVLKQRLSHRPDLFALLEAANSRHHTPLEKYIHAQSHFE